MIDSDRAILLYMAKNPGWYKPKKILDGTDLKGYDNRKPMSLPNIIKRCELLIKNGFLISPDPEKDSEIYRIYNKGIFCIKNDIETLKNLINVFKEKPEWLEFHHSAYCQKMINIDFVKNIKSKWNYLNDEIIRNRYRSAIFFEDYDGEICELPSLLKYQIDISTQTLGGKKILNLTKEKRMEMADDLIKGLTNHLFGAPLPYLSDDELLFILKSSPSALKFSLTDILSQSSDVALSEIKNENERLKRFAFAFCWENVPGIDEDRIKNFLICKGIDWVKNAKIEKSDNGTKINVFDDNVNSLFYRFDEGKNKVYLKIDKKTYEMDVKEIKKGCNLVFPDSGLIFKFKNPVEIWESTPEKDRRRYNYKMEKHIQDIFIEQILINFISDIRLNLFTAQNPYFTNLKVILQVQFSLDGQEKICKTVNYETHSSYQ